MFNLGNKINIELLTGTHSPVITILPHTHTHIYLLLYGYIFGGAHSVIDIVVENRYGDLISKPGRGCLHSSTC